MVEKIRVFCDSPYVLRVEKRNMQCRVWRQYAIVYGGMTVEYDGPPVSGDGSWLGGPDYNSLFHLQPTNHQYLHHDDDKKSEDRDKNQHRNQDLDLAIIAKLFRDIQSNPVESDYSSCFLTVQMVDKNMTC